MIEKEQANRSLLEFTKQAWHVVEPHQPFINNWHIGCKCLPFDARITTVDGPKAIGEIVGTGWSGMVLSWNHAEDAPEWRRVTGWIESPGRPLVRVVLTNGGAVTVTDNHPVFVKGKGYVRADQVCEGDTVLQARSVREAAKPEVSGQGDVLLQEVSLRRREANSLQHADEPGVQGVRQGILPLSFPAEERPVLRHEVFREKQSSSAASVRGLRQARSAQKQAGEVQYVMGTVEKKREDSAVPTMRSERLQERLRMEGKPTDIRGILQPPLFREVRDRAEQPFLHPRPESSRVSIGLHSGKETRLSPRWSALFFVRPGKEEDRKGASSLEPGNSSHRLGQNEQPELEPCGALHQMPPRSERVAGGGYRFVESHVRSIDRLLRIPASVYNIEVAGNHNYFADSVLVHNCEHLQAVSKMEITKLIINEPPRHTKSLVSSVMWFCWEWARNPRSRWLYSSYDLKLASRDSVRCRDVIVSEWYQSQWGYKYKLKDDQNVKTWFTNNEQGYRISTASGGKGLGHGGDFVITDDPHGGKDVWSETQRNSVIEWWTQRMSTRGFPGRSRHVVVMQRLHEKDLSGHLLAEKLGYELLCLPTRYEPTRVFFNFKAAEEAKARDPIVMTSLQQRKPSTRDPRTEEGELLWKAVFDDKSVADWSKTLGAYGTAGQLQQRPAPAQGTIFQNQMFRTFREELREKRPAFILTTDGDDAANERWVHVSKCRFFQTIDTAQKLKKQNDFTAVGTWALTPWSDLLLWHMWRGKVSVPFQFELMKAFRTNRTSWDEEAQRIQKWEPWPKALLFQAVEDASSGTGLIQLSQAAGIPFKPLSADKDPMERVAAIASLYASGKVYHRQGEEWVSDYEDELLGFPNAAHDDRETTAAYAGYLVQHDVILRQGLERELFVSDRETMDEAEARRSKDDSGKYKVNLGGGIKLDVQFDD